MNTLGGSERTKPGYPVGLSPPVESRFNRLLKIICGLLILMVASQTLLSLAGIPGFYQRVTTGSVPTLVNAGQTEVSNALVAQWAAERGMTLPTYALYIIVLNLVITLGFASIAGLILWKARREWFHWFTALVLLFIPSGGLWLFTLVSGVAYRYVAVGGLLWPTFLLFLYLFPNGRAVPRWTRWIIGVLATLHLALQTIGLAAENGYSVDELFAMAIVIFPFILGVAIPLILFSQIYRYMRVSTNTERAQIKWFVVGLALWVILGQLIQWVTATSDSQSVAESGLGGDIGQLLMLIIPASIGIGILRYRLYEIDVIIRRTLVYGLLTAALALLYFGSVIVIQQLFRALTGDPGRSPVAIVISTLAIAALFAPLRARIQQLVDRRFFRQRYNAEETLRVFSSTLRDEVNLEQLSSYLISVVQQTIQPEQTSLWLREVDTRAREQPARERV